MVILSLEKFGYPIMCKFVILQSVKTGKSPVKKKGKFDILKSCTLGKFYTISKLNFFFNNLKKKENMLRKNLEIWEKK